MAKLFIAMVAAVLIGYMGFASFYPVCVAFSTAIQTALAHANEYSNGKLVDQR